MTRFFSFLVGTAHAQAGDGPGVSEMWNTICTTLPFCHIGTDAPAFFAQRLVNFLFPLIVAAAVCAVVYAGIKMITGGEDGYGEAKTIIWYTGLGLILALLTSTIFAFVGSYLAPLLFG